MGKFPVILAAAFLALMAMPAFADDISDPWSTGAPADPQWEDSAQAVLSQNLITVPEDEQPAALRRLAKKDIVPLDAKTAAKLMGAAPAPSDAALKPYLVRGILLDGVTGGFTAEVNKGDLWVSYTGLSAAAPKALHRALVVFLPATPTKVYVSASFLT